MLSNQQRLRLAASLEAQLETATDPKEIAELRRHIHNMRQLVKNRPQDYDPNDLLGEVWPTPAGPQLEWLTAAGVAEARDGAYAEAMTNHVLPQLATKADLEQLRHDLTTRMIGIVVSIVGAMNGLLYAMLRLTA